MALVIGSETADAGMSKAIFDQVDRLLSPPLAAAVASASGEPKVKAQEALDKAREGWRKLSFAIATGVVGHLLSNMEVTGVQTKGSIDAAGSGSTDPSPPGPHPHTFAVRAKQVDVTFTQSNNGTGRVK